jgi:hypothetical protein
MSRAISEPPASTGLTLDLLEPNTHLTAPSVDQPRSKQPSSVNGDASFTRQRFNPHLLLNPKGFNKRPSPVDDRPSYPVSGNTALPLTNLTNGHPKPNAAPNGASHDTNNKLNGLNMASAMEKLHGVTAREDRPQKRRKTESLEGQEGEVKSKFAGGGKGGVIGEYMREQKEAGKSEASKPSQVVDLTAGMYTALARRV